jgi:hypothetical protein
MERGRMASRSGSESQAKAPGGRGREVESWLEALSPDNTNEASRTRAFKSLMALAKKDPDRLLPFWSNLDRLLRGGRAFSKFPAVHLLAALAPADRQGRFEKSFPAFFALLGDEAVSVASHVARLAGEIAAAKPALEPRITRRLLAIDRSGARPDRKDLIKAYALEGFERYFEGSSNQKGILAFAEGMLTAKSPRARKAAREFLARHKRS